MLTYRYDHDEFDRSLADEHEHAHVIAAAPSLLTTWNGTSYLGHGQPTDRVYIRRGYWYAVHTH